jgi:hypothetical protein
MKQTIFTKITKILSKLKVGKEETILAAEFLKMIDQSELKK